MHIEEFTSKFLSVNDFHSSLTSFDILSANHYLSLDMNIYIFWEINMKSKTLRIKYEKRK